MVGVTGQLISIPNTTNKTMGGYRRDRNMSTFFQPSSHLPVNKKKIGEDTNRPAAKREEILDERQEQVLESSGAK